MAIQLKDLAAEKVRAVADKISKREESKSTASKDKPSLLAELRKNQEIVREREQKKEIQTPKKKRGIEL